MGKYEAELRYDFAALLPGVSFGELWRLRRWRVLLSLIDQLPDNSRFREALALDEDAAREYLESRTEGDSEESAEPSRFQVRDMTPEGKLLHDIANQLRLLRMEQFVTAGASPPRVDLLKGPRTAMDGVAYRHRMKEHLQLSARLLPHKSEELLAKAEDL